MKVIPIENDAHWHKLRSENIGGSECAALWGLSPYTTRYVLWNLKARLLPPEDLSDNERVLAGIFLEPAVAAWASKKWGVELRKFSGYVVHESVKGMGCTPDYIDRNATILVQIKCVDGLVFRKEWEADGETITQAPMHILLQVQHELACTGMATGWLVVLVGGNRLCRMIVEARAKTAQKLCAEVEAFWHSIIVQEAPAPDFAMDGDAISALHLTADKEKVIDLSGNNRAHALCGEWLHGDDLEGQGKALKDAARAELTTLLGDAAKATVGDCTVSMPFVKASVGKAITQDMVGTIIGARAAHRRFSISTQEEGK